MEVVLSVDAALGGDGEEKGRIAKLLLRPYRVRIGEPIQKTARQIV
jgi:hypothetical protein